MDQTPEEPLLVEFTSGISPHHAEEVIKKLGVDVAPNRKVLLRFLGYPYVNPGAGWRIGNALRRYSGGHLEAEVPPFGKGDWFRTFTRSGLGDAIAAHASVIRSEGSDIAGDVRRFYQERSSRQDQNAVFFGELHRGLSVNPDREDSFRDAFLGSLRYTNVRASYFDRERVLDIIKLVFEAIQNVYDHARRKPLPDGTSIVSYFLLSYYKSVAGHSDPTGNLKAYVERLSASTNRKRADFIQVCVNDDGVGIAARQAQDLAVYSGNRETEEQAVREALTARSSVKLRSQDTRIRGTPGEGYTYIDACLKSLRAFAVLRTGRLLAAFDGTDPAGSGFVVVPTELGYMPGTTLDVLIPIPDQADPQPTLFPE